MVAGEGEKGRGRCRGSSRATTRFYLTGSVVMLKAGSETKTRSGERRGMVCFVALVLREDPVKTRMRMKVSPQINLARLVKSGPTGSLSAHCCETKQCASATGVDLRCRFCSRSLHSSVAVLERCRGMGVLFDGWRTVSADCLVADTQLW